MSLRARGCRMERDGKARAGGQWGGAPEQLPGEQGQDPSPRGQDGPGRAAGQESTRAPTTLPAWPEALRGSWREAQQAGQEEELLEDGGCVAVGAQSAHPVPFLPALPVTPHLPLKPREGSALGCFTQRVAGQAQDSAGDALEGSGFQEQWESKSLGPTPGGATCNGLQRSTAPS